MTDDPSSTPPTPPGAPPPSPGPNGSAGSPASAGSAGSPPAAADSPARPAGGDELPEELDITVARPYQVPDNSKRRIAAACYVVVAAACAAGTAVSGNGGLLAAAVFLALAAAYHLASAWPLKLDETSALAASAAAAGFPVGHASAQLAWRGLRSRPVWRVLLYSADEPPSKRGLVELDAVDGEILGTYTEENPEDWSAYGFSPRTPSAPGGSSASGGPAPS